EMDKISAEIEKDDCQKKLRCALSPYSPSKCCPGQTPHHLVEAGSFYDKGREEGWQKDGTKQTAVFGASNYDEAKAPCVCVEGESQNQGTHKLMHQAQDKAAKDCPHVPNPNPFFRLEMTKKKKTVPVKMRRLDNAVQSGVDSVNAVFPSSGCD